MIGDALEKQYNRNTLGGVILCQTSKAEVAKLTSEYLQKARLNWLNQIIDAVKAHHNLP